jgi:hypothetical protein
MVPPPSGLNLTPDDGFVGRTKDVLAQHGDIYCPDQNDFCTVPPMTCPTTALLIDSTTPANSWITAKLEGQVNGCGEVMPNDAYDATKKACIEMLVTTIAALPK